MSFIQKLRYILSYSQKKELFFLGILLFIGLLFEMAGLGILIPALGIMLKPDIGKEYPSLKPYLERLGNPTQIQLVLWGMSALVLLYLVKALFLVFVSWRQSKFSANISTDIAKRLFLGYLRQPYTFHLNNNSGILLRNISEAANLSVLANTIMLVLLELSIVLGVGFMLILVEPVGALFVTITLGLAAWFFHKLTKNKLLYWGERRQFHSGKSSVNILQSLAGIKDIILMGRDDYFSYEHEIHNDANAKIQIRVTTLGLIPRLYLELLAVIGLTGLIVVMVVQGKPLDLLLPTLGVFAAAAFRIIPSVNRIMVSMQNIRTARPLIDLLYDEFKSLKNSQKIQPQSTDFTFSRSITLNSISFSYPNSDHKAVRNVSINIQKGESIGFIGLSGSGKSTLVDLILGLLNPQKGEILVDDINIQNNLRGWQDQIGYVPQSIFLTDDTLRRNVAFGIPDSLINEASIARAIKAAQMDEFIASLQEGLETFVGERGVRLSGGQRQRIGIARALYNDPDILVLDEATSALDSTTETGVMDAVSKLKGNKTLIIVAHRLSTIENCDRLYKLSKGEIIEEGIPKVVLKA